MDKDALINFVSSEEYTLSIRKLMQEVAISEQAIVSTGNNLTVEAYLGWAGNTIVRGVLRLACMEEPIKEIPVNWWEHLKQTLYRSRRCPKWIQRRFPVQTVWVCAVHKFPEVSVPEAMLGREFVHLRLVDPWKIQDKL